LPGTLEIKLHRLGTKAIELNAGSNTDESAVFASTDGRTDIAHDTDIWRLTGNLLCSPYAGHFLLTLALFAEKEISFELNFIFVPN